MRLKQQKPQLGQALVEFGLVMPLLLLFALLVMDFGRALIGYTSASSSLRRAVRYAEVIGFDDASPVYLDCAAMLDQAQQTYFVDWSNPVTNDISIYFISHETGAKTNCTAATENSVKNGDMLVIDMQAHIRMLNPFVNNWIQFLEFDFSGQRTVVKNIEMDANVEDDEDYDGLDDAWELTEFGNLNAIGTEDPDNDGCNNGCEETRGTDPNVADTDGDGLSDGDEAYVHLTYPLDEDSDDDLLLDGEEIAAGSDPFTDDSDGDTLKDGEEVKTHLTNPLMPDTDSDTLLDPDEVAGYDIDGDGTADLFPSPIKADSDDDTLSDAVEVAGYDVNADGIIDYYSDPQSADVDADGLTDVDERAGYASSSTDGGMYYPNPMASDADGDGLDDASEKIYGTDPNSADIDEDGLNDREEVLTYGTDPHNADSDGDKLLDGNEVNIYGTDPLVFDEDADFDGIPDAWEETYFDPRLAPDILPTEDEDQDDCNNLCEFNNGLEPNNADSDGDNVKDGPEIFGYNVPGLNITVTTDPRNKDTDGDGLEDGEEAVDGFLLGTVRGHTDPTVPDTDGDGLTDGQETLGVVTIRGLFQSNPLLVDTDNDTLIDAAEVLVHTTNPNNADSDSDGLNDNVELRGDMGYFTLPYQADTDSDGLTDGEEVNGLRVLSSLEGLEMTRTYFSDPTEVDTDGDNITDADELDVNVGTSMVTDPNFADTDGDTLNDLDEINGTNGVVTDPTLMDTDGDMLTDSEEFQTHKTNPALADTDGDSISDGDEIRDGSDPLDPNDPGRDTDKDGLQDDWEMTHFSNLTSNSGTDDPDGEGCNNLCEQSNETDPNNADSDGDGVNDYAEISGSALSAAGFTGMINPRVADTDGDGLSDGFELSHTPPTDPTQITAYLTVSDGNGTGTVNEPVCARRSQCGEYTFADFTVTLHNDTHNRTDDITLHYRTLDASDTLSAGSSETAPTATGSSFKNNDPGSIQFENDFRATDDRLSVYTVSFAPLTSGAPQPAIRTETVRILVYSDNDTETGGEVMYLEIYDVGGIPILDNLGKLTIYDPAG